MIADLFSAGIWLETNHLVGVVGSFNIDECLSPRTKLELANVSRIFIESTRRIIRLKEGSLTSKDNRLRAPSKH